LFLSLRLSVDVLFTSDSIFCHKQEQHLAGVKTADPELGDAIRAGDRGAMQRKQSYRPRFEDAETRFTENAAAGSEKHAAGGQRFD
jgi:hypothetical protein